MSVTEQLLAELDSLPRWKGRAARWKGLARRLWREVADLQRQLREAEAALAGGEACEGGDTCVCEKCWTAHVADVCAKGGEA